MLGVHGNVCVRERERERQRTGLNVRKICKRERGRERERERGDLKKSFSGYVIKFFFGQRQIEVYLHCSGRYEPFNITNCSFTQVFDSSEDDACFSLLKTLTKMSLNK